MDLRMRFCVWARKKNFKQTTIFVSLGFYCTNGIDDKKLLQCG